MRPDLDVIADLVPASARVLDLGCGDGQLLETLIARGAEGLGIEISDEDFFACLARGVPVLQADIDKGLGDIEDDSFDVVILSLTLQAVHRPALVLREMSRVARSSVVSFPNFAHWRLRTQLAVSGRMPVSPLLPYAWHETPNIRLCSIKDFEWLVQTEGLTIARRVLLDEAGHPVRRDRGANLFAAGAVYLLQR